MSDEVKEAEVIVTEGVPEEPKKTGGRPKKTDEPKKTGRGQKAEEPKKTGGRSKKPKRAPIVKF